jgi:WD40 repeat protein
LQRTIRLETSAFIRDVAFSAEGKQIAAVVDYPIFSPRPHVRKIVGRRAAFVVWDVATGGEVRSLQPPGLKPATRPLERRRFSVGDDLRLLITSTGLIDTVTAKTVIAFEQPAVAHAFNRDATLAAVGTAAGQVTVWDVASGRKRDTWFVPAAGIRTLAFRPDGRAVAAACSDGSIRIRGVAALDGSAATHPSKVADGRSEIPLRTDSTVSDLAFTPDGGHLMTAHAPRGGLAAFRVWEAERRPALVLREVETPLGLGGPAAAISPDGRLVAAIGADHSVVLSNAITGDVVRRLPGTKRRAAVAFSRDGTLVAACGRDGFFVWSTGSGRLLRNFRPSGASLCTAPAFSPDGRHFAGSHAGGVTVWDLRTGSLVRRFRSGRHYCNSVAFSSDGTFLCATSDRGGCIWNVPQWTERCRLPDAHSTRGVLSPDDAIFATVGAGGIALTDTRTGKRTRLIPLRESSRVVAFSPDGKRLATTAGSRLLILDVKTGERVMTLSGHRGGINSVVFSRDGRRIVSAAADGTARIWGEPPLVSRLQAAGCGLIGVGLHIEPPEGGTPAGEARPPVVAPRPRRESRSAGR